MMKKTRILALLMAVALLVGLLGACGTPSSTSPTPGDTATPGDTGEPTPTPDVQTTEPTPNGDSSAIYYHLGATPKSLDPQKNNATDGATVIQSCFDGLTRRDKDSKIVPGIAESWDISDDQLVWTFHLRDALWSDGKPVTSDDFVFGLQRLVDPMTECEYSYQGWYIKNGEKITTGADGLTPADLGVKAIDEKTLEITLAGPCGYFTEVTAFPALYPVRRDIVTANADWALKPETYITNGAYKISEFTQQDKIVMVKSETYWDSASMPCPTVVNLLTDDDAAALIAFQTGEMDIAESFPAEETQSMKDQGFFRVAPIIGTYFSIINIEKNNDALMNREVRRALALAIDRQYIIDVIQNEGIPAYAFVCPGMPDITGDFRENGGNYFGSGNYETDLAEAKEILKTAGYSVDGSEGKALPNVTYKFNTNTGHQKVAELLQDQWKQLGLNVSIETMEWAVFQTARTEGDFEIARHGWLGDYVDPMTFLDMWVSGSGQNDCRFKNAEFDTLIDTAKKSSDQALRMESLHKAEKLLMDEYCVIPIYYYTNLWLDNGKVKDYVHDPLLGHMFFKWASKTA